jgi:hypothetical protein
MIPTLTPFPLLVILPPGNCVLDVRRLALLGTATEQEDQTFAIFTKIDAVAGPKSSLYSKTP